MKKRIAIAVLAVGILGAVCFIGANVLSSFTAGTSKANTGGVGEAVVAALGGEQSDTLDLSELDSSEALESVRSERNLDRYVTAIIDAKSWTPAELNALHEAGPDLVLEGPYTVGAEQVDLSATELDLSNVPAEDLPAFSEAAGCFANLTSVNFGSEEGHAKLAAVSEVKQAKPDIRVSYAFTCFGKGVDYNDTTLDFRGTPMDDNGEDVRSILALMPHVEKLDMDTCGVDDEHMAAIRDDFPNVDVVWRIWFGTNYTARTDVEKILASAPGYGGELTNENSTGLKYCTKIKYLDIGHAGYIPDISFVSYMPDLEVFICILDGITDISPLANCPHLEFLEIFSNDITDLSPLSGLTELRHLNCSWNARLADITPIYGLNLERFWCGQMNSVPVEQFEEYKALHPDCWVNYTPSNPHEDWRWGNARYDLLDQQLGYSTEDYALPQNDPLYVWPEG